MKNNDSQPNKLPKYLQLLLNNILTTKEDYLQKTRELKLSKKEDDVHEYLADLYIDLFYQIINTNKNLKAALKFVIGNISYNESKLFLIHAFYHISEKFLDSFESLVENDKKFIKNSYPTQLENNILEIYTFIKVTYKDLLLKISKQNVTDELLNEFNTYSKDTSIDDATKEYLKDHNNALIAINIKFINNLMHEYGTLDGKSLIWSSTQINLIYLINKLVVGYYNEIKNNKSKLEISLFDLLFDLRCNKIIIYDKWSGLLSEYNKICKRAHKNEHIILSFPNKILPFNINLAYDTLKSIIKYKPLKNKYKK